MYISLLCNRATVHVCREPCVAKLKQAVKHAGKTNVFIAELKAMELVKVVQAVT